VPDNPTSAVGPILSVLRTLPVWVLAGLAAAGYAILFLPDFAGVQLAPFRAKYGVWIRVATLIFSSLALARAIDSGVSAYRARRNLLEDRRALRLVPRHFQCWWHLAKQQDNSFVTQMRLDIDAANVTDQSVRIVKVRLVRPRAKGQLLHAEVSLPMAGSPYHDPIHPVSAHETVAAHLHLMVRGSLAAQGHPLRVTLGITDQFGEEYLLKRITLQSHQAGLPKRSWAQRVVSEIRKLRTSRTEKRAQEDEARRLAKEWNHGGSFGEVELILKEERRFYAANGRRTGGLGSLNVGLQSEPGFGGTTVGSVPTLLWEKDLAVPVDSPNLKRVLKLWGPLGEKERVDLERFLLSHLNKNSPYADISYFNFLALHRMSRTTDALSDARSHLAGDSVYGYSNVLGTLAAVVSREHFTIEPALFARIQKVLEGDPEYDFRLAEKINLARLLHLDSELRD